MASVKGGDYFWGTSAAGASVAAGGKSTLVYVGPGPYVTIYINNSGGVNATFKVQVSGTAKAQPGRNALDGSADGGLTWYDYTGSGGVGAETTIAVNATAAVALDLAPFSPEFVRLVRTDGLAATTITAFATSYGPN